MTYTDIHSDAFSTERFNAYEYAAELVVSESREPSQRLVDNRAQYGQPIPKLVWYMKWHQVDRPAPFDTEKEIIPPLDGGELRSAQVWRHTLESFAKCGYVITKPEDFKKVAGLTFRVSRGDMNTGSAARPFIQRNVVTPLRVLTATEIASLSQNNGHVAGVEVTDDETEVIREFIKDTLTANPVEWSALVATLEGAFNGDNSPEVSTMLSEILNDTLTENLIAISAAHQGKLVWNE